MGFIPKELSKAVAQRLDNLIKLKGIAEVLDGPLLKLSIDLFDETLGDNVPIEYREEILNALQAFADDDMEAIQDTVADTFNKLIDIPGVDEDDEKYWLASTLKMLGGFIAHLAKKRKSTS